MILELRSGATKEELAALNEKLRELALRKEREAHKGKVMEARKYCGTINLKEDPLEIQRKMRDEWE